MIRALGYFVSEVVLFRLAKSIEPAGPRNGTLRDRVADSLFTASAWVCKTTGGGNWEFPPFKTRP